MMSTKKELAKKLASVLDKSTTAILKEYKKDQIIRRLEKAHKKGLISKHVYLETPKRKRSKRMSNYSSGSRGSSKKEGVYVVKLTKDELARELAKIRPESKSVLVKKYSRDQLERRLKDAQKKGKIPKHVYLSTPKKSPKRESSRSKSSGSKSRRKSTRVSRVPCKSYQIRNENGRCVNKPCKEGKIRDKLTKKCRSKKNPIDNLKKVSSKKVSSKKVSSKKVSSKKVSSKKVSSKYRRKSRVPCKSYQIRNENGRCVNKPCKEGKIRDKLTKKCRSKKNPIDNLKKVSSKKVSSKKVSSKKVSSKKVSSKKGSSKKVSSKKVSSKKGSSKKSLS